MNRIKIMETPFDRVNEREALEIILKIVASRYSRSHLIATPNPEMLLAADKNPEFKKILNSTDLNIADGTGILWASTYLDDIKSVMSEPLKILIGIKDMFLAALQPSRIRKILPERVTGTDMMELICKNIGDSASVYLLGGSGDTAKKTAIILNEKYQIRVAGTNNGSSDSKNEKNIINHINSKNPDILFIAFGTPKQEIWLARNLSSLKTVKVAMGVGGAFDFISGNIKRAPLSMRRLGLEWLYRLVKQPSRVKRIINATIVFPFKVIKSSLR